MLRRPTEEQRRRQEDAEAADRRTAAETMTAAEFDELLAEIDDPDMRASLERMRATIASANPPSGQNEAVQSKE
jgi:hypothetical protein